MVNDVTAEVISSQTCRRWSGKWRRTLLFLLLAGWTLSAWALGGSIPPVELIAPQEVRDVLREHFALPDKLLRSEAERALFMRRAQREIPELLATEGYFSGKVALRKVTGAGVLELEVLPGSRTLVGTVDIEFRGDLASPDPTRSARARQLRAAWPLASGKPFRAAAWDDAKAVLLSQVSSADYAAARMVESAASVDVAKASAALHLVIDSGPRVVFGELQVNGLERYEEYLVARHAGFARGQPYRRDLLLGFQSRLQSLPQFSSVVVSLDTDSAQSVADVPEAVAAPIRVKVTEAPSRKISVGLGYSTNNGVRKELNYQSYNFLDQAWTLNSALVVEQNRQAVSAGLDTPPNPLGYRLAWKGSGEKTQIQGLQTRLDKFGVMRSRNQFGIESGLGLSWQQERRLPLAGIQQTNQALVLDWRWRRSRVDNPLAPMSGELTEVRISGASKSLASDQDFVRSYLRHQVWLPLGEEDVLAVRVEGGYTASTTRLGIPQEYLFRTGGTQTVRGFAYQSLGYHEGGAVVGGRVMATTSIEYTHWFGNLGMALFTDAGDAADTAPALMLKLGYGAGLRWRSPVGPLALDVARGKGEPSPRAHFAIEVAF